jgi:5-methylcytosine-specific restriction endonuclease McrA
MQARTMQGQTFQHWTVVQFSHIKEYADGQRVEFWTCRCVCGTIRAVRKPALIQGQTKSCYRGSCRQSPFFEDLTGRRFHNVTVLSRLENGQGGHARFKVQCACGLTWDVASRDLKGGKIKNCNNHGCKMSHTNAGEGSRNKALSHIIKNATKRGHLFNLSSEFAFRIMSEPCFYCGCAPALSVNRSIRTPYRNSYLHNGIDRVNNALGYEETNVVSCCVNCNRMKSRANIEMMARMIAFIERSEPERQLHPVCIPRAFPSQQVTVINQKLSAIKRRAAREKIIYALTPVQAYSLMGGLCFYCGCPPTAIYKNVWTAAKDLIYQGIDRVNNHQGYLPTNCVPCCWSCNQAKGSITLEMARKALTFLGMITSDSH